MPGELSEFEEHYHPLHEVPKRNVRKLNYDKNKYIHYASYVGREND
jgi:hypothetical protein